MCEAFAYCLAPINSGEPDKPIVFQAYNSEKVVISAMQSLDSWQLDTKGIYVTQVDWDLLQQNFVIQGNTVMNLARWPNNVDGDPFTQNTLRNTTGSALDGKPDAGAYELNTQWEAGIDWDPTYGPSGRGCYGLPSETCEHAK